MEELTFEYDKKRNLRKKIVSGFLILLSVVFFVHGFEVKSPYLVGVFGALFLLNAYLFYRTLSPKPAVVVNAEGIHTKVNAIGMVPWEYINGFSSRTFRGNDYVVVDINDHTAFMATKKSAVQFMMRSNVTVFESPVIIPKRELGLPVEEVIEQLEAYQSQRNAS